MIDDLEKAIREGVKESSELVIDKPFNKVARMYYATMKKLESLLSDN